MYDVAVIGGGLSGLTASIYLARAGLSVTVLEKSSQLGGRAVTVKQNGALFDLGSHGFYLGGAAEQVLKELGVPLRGGYPSPKGSIVRGSEIIPVPANPVTLLVSRHFTGGSKLAFIRLMLRMRKLDPGALPPISLREWAEAEVSDPMLRHLVYALCRTSSYVPDPDALLARPAVRRLQLSLLPNRVLYVDGGWGTLVGSLRAQATSAGVTILKQHHITTIERDGSGAVGGIRLADGTPLKAAHVITTAGPGEVCHFVQDAERTVLKEWRDQSRPSQAASLSVALRRLPVTDPYRRTTLFLDQPLFVSTPSAVARASEDGSAVVHVTKYLGAGPGDPRADERQMEGALDLVQPGWRAEVTARQFLPRMTVTHGFDAVATAGRRFGPAVPEVRGLYVAGDWTGREETLADAVFASARRAAQAVIADSRKQPL